MAAEERYELAAAAAAASGAASSDEEGTELAAAAEAAPADASQLHLLGSLFAELAHFNARVAQLLAQHSATLAGTDGEGEDDTFEAMIVGASGLHSRAASAATAQHLDPQHAHPSQTAAAHSNNAFPNGSSFSVATTSGALPRLVQKRPLRAGRRVVRKVASVLFDEHHRPRMRALYPSLPFQAISKLVADAWLKVSPEEKARFEKMAANQHTNEEQQAPPSQEPKRRRLDHDLTVAAAADAPADALPLSSSHGGPLASPLGPPRRSHSDELGFGLVTPAPSRLLSLPASASEERLPRPAPLFVSSGDQEDDQPLIQLLDPPSPSPSSSRISPSPPSSGLR